MKQKKRGALKTILAVEVVAILCVCCACAGIALKPDLLTSFLPVEVAPINPFFNPTLSPGAKPITPITTVNIPETEATSPAVPGGGLPSTPADSFAPDSAHELAPPDVLEEISFYGTGGNLDPAEASQQPFCAGNYQQPAIFLDMDDGELMQVMELKTCGWPAGEALQGTVIYPDGRLVRQKVMVNDCGCAVLSHAADLLAPEGVYTFQLSNPAGITLTTNTLLQQPAVPRIYALTDDLLLFYNFLPNETVRLFMYSFSRQAACGDTGRCWVLQGWQEFQLGADGSLLIQAPVREGYFVAVDSQGYQFATQNPPGAFGPMWQINPDFQLAERRRQELFKREKAYLACPAGIESVVQFSSEPTDFIRPVRVAAAAGLNMYARPRTTARVLATLNQGVELEVYSLEYCFENHLWRLANWVTPTGDSVSGYLMEGDLAGNYFIQEIPK